MPEICRFYGIIIKLFYREHNPPHFHAEYGSDEVLIEIRTLAIFAGKDTSKGFRTSYGVGFITSGRITRIME